jgi:hypothetical protein
MNFARWFKAQGSDFLDMRLRRLPAGLFKHFYFIRCVAACNGGALPPVEKIAFLLGSRVPVVERRLAALMEAGLIAEEGGVLRIVEGDDEGAVVEAPGEPLSGAERTKRWRERRAAEGISSTDALCHGDEAVTPGDAIDIDQKEDTESPRVTRGAKVYDRFEDFLAAFPERDEPTPREPVALAWGKAVHAGADPAELVRSAKAYREATAGREKRFIVGAVRWLSEGRWRSTTELHPVTAEAGVWVKQGSAEWEAWSAHWQATKGKRPPIDAKGGWRFPTLAPPDIRAAA